MEYEFGPWLPDQRDFRNPGLEKCVNAIPGPNGYRPAQTPVSTGASISGTIIGAFSVYLRGGEVLYIVATQTDIHTVRAGTVTASGLALSLADTDRVVFEQFNTKVFASTKNGATWVLSDIETDNTFSASAGSPPSANAMGRVADFLVMGDLIDVDTSNAPYRIRWSKFNNPEGLWDTDIGDQSGATELDAKFGPVTAITGGDFGLVFQRQGVSRLSYTGGATVFDLDTFEENRGCVAPASVVRVGERVFYMAHDGFFVTDGTTPAPISTGKIWDWFLTNVNQTFISSVVGAVDYERRCVVWLFPGGNTQARTKQLWFYWDAGQWGYVDQALDWAVSGTKSGLTLEQVGAAYPDIDAMTLSLDSNEFRPSGRNLIVIENGNVSNLTGANLEATFTSGDLHPFVGGRAFISEVTPLVEADNVSVTLGCKERMTRDFEQSLESEMGPIGFAPFNHDARYFRVEIRIPQGENWGNAHGYQLVAVPSGAV